MSSKRTAVVSAALVPVLVISAILACIGWVSSGICADSVLPTLIAVLSLIFVIVLVRNDRICESDRRLAEQDVYLKMVAGPVERKKEPIKGKMPNQKDL